MQNPEDFRQKYLQRPQVIKDERVANATQLQEAQVVHIQQLKNTAQQKEQEKAELLRQQLINIQQIYAETGIKARMEAIASIISSGEVAQSINISDRVENASFAAHIIQTTISYRLLYHAFAGRPIIDDDSLYHSPSLGPGWTTCSGGHGEKLDKLTNLTDFLEVSITYPYFHWPTHGKTNTVRLDLIHRYWEQEEMSWTKAKFFKKGWKLTGGRFDRDIYFDFVEGKPVSNYVGSFEQVLENGFNQIYDSYLSVTDKI